MGSKSFADIYSQWEKTHDEEREIARRARISEATGEDGPTINQIRRMTVQDELDLHEMLLDDAVAASRSFLDSSYSRGLRKVRIITGKGIHSKNGEAVLRPGKYGYYLRHGEKNIRIAKEYQKDEEACKAMTKETAISFIK